MTKDEELSIYRNFLIHLHTCRWTFADKEFARLMDRLAAYSYARTNSNGQKEEEERLQEETLKNLK